ncbi:MAG TPA: Hpt domain-containing protein, partial [Gammaproteobacteria bacterium]|nr:Hpt domain-containing protein [Gammaproteobacteria bacterium]
APEIINWDKATQLAGGKRELAEDLLAMFVRTLPNDISLIKQSHSNHDQKTLAYQIHKLHGAVCYCGLPRIKNVLGHLESELKNNIMVSLPTLLDQLYIEVSLLLEHYSRLKNNSGSV